MADYLLEIAENGRHVCVQRGHVVILENGEVLGRIPVDALGAVILSAEGVTLSRHFMARMAEERVPVIICGADYMPLSMALPYSAHYKNLAVVKKQMEASPVLKKQLWKILVEAKIRNQAHALSLCAPERADVREELRLLAGKVRSGDADNKEAHAARLYWPALFGREFTRDVGADGINAFLNYGYAVVRASCARALCGAGPLPMLGIHHHNMYNAFCLADDLMEPLRPFVDQRVFSCARENPGGMELSPRHKKTMAGILRAALPFCGQEHTLASITTHMAQALARCFSQGEARLPVPGPLPA